MAIVTEDRDLYFTGTHVTMSSHTWLVAAPSRGQLWASPMMTAYEHKILTV